MLTVNWFGQELKITEEEADEVIINWENQEKPSSPMLGSRHDSVRITEMRVTISFKKDGEYIDNPIYKKIWKL